MLFMEDTEGYHGPQRLLSFSVGWNCGVTPGVAPQQGAQGSFQGSEVFSFEGYLVAVEKLFIGCSPGSHPDKSDLDIVDIIWECH